MTEKTAYVVMLPLTSEDELSLTEKATDYVWGSLNSIVDAIGTPVDSSVPVVGTIHIGDNGKPFFTAPELYSVGGDVVRRSEHLAALAEKQAEVERLREYYAAASQYLEAGVLATTEQFDRLCAAEKALIGAAS